MVESKNKAVRIGGRVFIGKEFFALSDNFEKRKRSNAFIFWSYKGVKMMDIGDTPTTVPTNTWEKCRCGDYMLRYGWKLKCIKSRWYNFFLHWKKR